MLKQIPKMLAYHRLFRNEPEDLRVKQVTTDDLLIKAKRLHSKVFSDRGYVLPDHLTADGLIGEIEDPYQKHAHYFVTERRVNGQWQVIASARLIFASPDLNSFQTIIHQQLAAEHKAKLESEDALKVFEVSALVKEKGESTAAVIMLYRTMWQYSVRHGCKYWIMSCDSRLYNRLTFMFGDAIEIIGKPVFFKGHDVVPALLDIQESLQIFRKQTRTLHPAKRILKAAIMKYFLKGMPESN